MKKLSKNTTLEQFLQEYNNLRAVTRGKHRHIVHLLRAFRYEDECAIIFYNLSFLLASGSLQQLFRLTGPTAGQEFGTDNQSSRFSNDFLTHRKDYLWTEFGGLASALEYLHAECGIVHLDIKPSNILLYEQPDHPYVITKLTDFGLAVNLRTKLTWQLGTKEAQYAWQFDGPEMRGRLSKASIGSARVLLPSDDELKSRDIWKLGSVFTELLSFLVLGYPGVPRFRRFITNTTKESTPDEISDIRFSEGTVVKPEVLEWLFRLETLNCRAREITPLLRQMLGKPYNRPSASAVARHTLEV